MSWFSGLFEQGGTFEKGGAANRLFDPLDIFGGAKQDSYARIEEANNISAQELKDTALKNQGIYDESYKDQAEMMQPWVTAGNNALKAIEEQPDFKFDAKSFDFFKDPSYEFRMSEGVNALDRSAASRGRLLSGAQDKAVTRYGQGLASTEYQNAFNRHQNSEKQRYNQEKGVYDVNMGNDQWVAGVGAKATNALADMRATNAQNKADTNMMATNALVDARTSNAQARSDTQNAISGGVGSGVGSIVGAITGSDIRFKNNIELIDKIDGINVYTWDWNNVAISMGVDKAEPKGVIAQELLHIMPEAVVENKGYYFVDYGMINLDIQGIA